MAKKTAKKKITSQWTNRFRTVNGKKKLMQVKKVGKRTLVRVIPKKNKFSKPKVLTRSVVQKKVRNHSIPKDRQRLAMPPGKRRSKSGKIYTEHRANRTDINRKKRL